MLTVTQIRALKPRQKPYKVADGRGLYIHVPISGSRLWRFKYRLPDGREKLLALGSWPDTSPNRAREKRDAARRLLDDGVDPSATRQAEATAARDTFQAIAEEWQATRPNLAEKTRTLARRRLEQYVYPHIGREPIASLQPHDVLAVLKRIEAKGKHVTTRKVRQLCGQVFRYAVATGRAKRDPTPDLRGALITPATKHRAAITDPKQVGALMRAIDDYDGQFTTAAALRLIALTFVRPGELRGASWAEFDLDSEKPTWRIPAERMKMRREHLVPLSRQVVDTLRSVESLTGRQRFVFSANQSGRPLSENTLNMGLRRMGYTGDVMTAHGFRAMASTLLHEQGFPPEVIELQLAHAQRSEVAAAYNRAAQLAKRQAMMQAWADYLDEVRTGAQVVDLRAQL